MNLRLYFSKKYKYRRSSAGFEWCEYRPANQNGRQYFMGKLVKYDKIDTRPFVNEFLQSVCPEFKLIRIESIPISETLCAEWLAQNNYKMRVGRQIPKYLLVCDTSYRGTVGAGRLVIEYRGAQYALPAQLLGNWDTSKACRQNMANFFAGFICRDEFSNRFTIDNLKQIIINTETSRTWRIRTYHHRYVSKVA